MRDNSRKKWSLMCVVLKLHVHETIINNIVTLKMAEVDVALKLENG